MFGGALAEVCSGSLARIPGAATAFMVSAANAAAANSRLPVVLID